MAFDPLIELAIATATELATHDGVPVDRRHLHAACGHLSNMLRQVHDALMTRPLPVAAAPEPTKAPAETPRKAKQASTAPALAPADPRKANRNRVLFRRPDRARQTLSRA
jgi:hypothetical protein